MIANKELEIILALLLFFFFGGDCWQNVTGVSCESVYTPVTPVHTGRVLINVETRVYSRDDCRLQRGKLFTWSVNDHV